MFLFFFWRNHSLVLIVDCGKLKWGCCYKCGRKQHQEQDFSLEHDLVIGLNVDWDTLMKDRCCTHTLCRKRAFFESQYSNTGEARVFPSGYGVYFLVVEFEVDGASCLWRVRERFEGWFIALDLTSSTLGGEWDGKSVVIRHTRSTRTKGGFARIRGKYWQGSDGRRVFCVHVQSRRGRTLPCENTNSVVTTIVPASGEFFGEVGALVRRLNYWRCYYVIASPLL